MFTGRKTIEIHPSLELLGTALLSCPHLNELDLSDNAVSVEGARALTAYLSTGTSLTVLRLNNTGVGSTGGTLVGQALLAASKRGLRLQTFALGRSRLEIPGAKAIGKALGAMGSLEEILLPQNGIRPAGIAFIAGLCSMCVSFS